VLAELLDLVVEFVDRLLVTLAQTRLGRLVLHGQKLDVLAQLHQLLLASSRRLALRSSAINLLIIIIHISSKFTVRQFGHVNRNRTRTRTYTKMSY